MAAKRKYTTMTGKKTYSKSKKRKGSAKPAPKRSYGYTQTYGGGFVNELKTIDINPTAQTIAGTDFDTTGTRYLLNGTSIGSAINQRIGRKIVGKKLLLRIQFYTNYLDTNLGALSKGAGVTWRMMVVYDKQANGGSLDATDLIGPTVPGGLPFSLGDARMIRTNNLNYRERFIVIRDKVIDTNEQRPCVTYKKQIYLKDLETTFQADAGIAADIATGSLWLLVWNDCDLVSPTGTKPSKMTFSVRYRFSDS